MKDVHKSREDFREAPDPVQALWNRRAVENTEELPDRVQKKLEVAKLLSLLKPRDEVLDVGCGNGRTALAAAPLVRRIHGLEYAPLLLEKALANHAPNLSYSQGDVRAMAFPDASFDTVYTQRVLINLNSLEEQTTAVREIRRVLRRNGRFLMLETSKSGLASLNRCRSVSGLSEIKAPWHNLPVDEEALGAEIDDIFRLEKTVSFGAYFFLSRVIQPLIVAPGEPSYDHPLNEIAADLDLKAPELISEMSQVKLLVFRSR